MRRPQVTGFMCVVVMIMGLVDIRAETASNLESSQCMTSVSVKKKRKIANDPIVQHSSQMPQPCAVKENTTPVAPKKRQPH
jgi:hypothetical protein